MKTIMKKIPIYLLILLIILIFIVFFTFYKIINWYNDSKITKINQNKILTKIKINEIKTDFKDNNTFINVNLTDLKKMNNDVVGWLKVNGTNINYPYVKTDNNTFYLTHSIDKSKNSAGWVFLDYRNNPDNYDKNNIIYAHARVDKTMFGSLKYALTKEWFNKEEEKIIKTSTLTENSIWQIFSVYKINNTTDYLNINFKDEDEFLKFSNKLKERSIFNFNIDINKDDKILTLSTCFNKNVKTVMHAKLIKTYKK